ncbi:Major Facilitator Superfamily protein [Promicromonospora umidemergens]|nr:Major Facilitator Superfamily protein [Promicromonospora umidemergens]
MVLTVSMRLIPVAYLSSYLLSLLGNSIAGVAFPLIVLQITGSALGAGTVAAATAVPAVLAGLVMGVVIDRINRRTSSVVTDLVSAVSVAALPVVDMVSGLSLGWFILFGIIGSLGDVPGMTARDALLPAIVRHGGISSERLVGIREGLGAVALLLGPAVAGTLMVLFDGSTVLWITAATSLLAALLTLLIPHRVGEVVVERDLVPPGSGWAQLRDGWQVLLRSPFLIATTALTVVSVLVLASLQGLVLPVWFTQIDQPGMLGFVLTALAAGMLVGAGVYAGAGARGARRTWFLTGLVGTTVGFGVVATLSSVWVVLAGAFVVGLSSGLFGSLMGVLMIERIPERMRGRIMGTQNAVMTAAPPVGLLAAAVLTEYISVEVAAIALAGVWLIAVAVGLFARSLRHLEPEPAATTDDAKVGAARA